MKKFSLFMCSLLIVFNTLPISGALPSKVYAPYVDVMLYPTFSLTNCNSATGQKYFTLAFVIAGYDNTPMWGGSIAMSANHMLDQITALRAAGGDVIVSFGGANGTPIDAVITDLNALVTAYSAVIDRYGLTWIDFDIEGYWSYDAASIDRRNAAAKLLQAKYPSLRITYCLPVMPTGLTAEGTNIISKAKAAGVNIYGVNIMAMDYGQSNSAMGDAAISAAQNTRNQTNLNIGITAMIGQNDTQNEVFTLANATQVLNFANSNSWVNTIAMWSVNRDNGGCPGATTASATCSGLSQSTFAFVNTFKPFSGGGGNTAPSVNITSPASGASFATGSNITISANASDVDGTISSVKFYQGSTLLGTDNSSPYSITWNGVAAGSYSLTAVATDNGGLSTTSSAVNINVGTTAPNLALNKTVVTSSNESATYAGASAVDGNLTTRWSSLFSDPQWIYVDLGATYNVTRVKITWEAAYAKDYKVELSANASTWTAIKTVTGNTALVNDQTGLSGTGRYVRVYGTARGTQWGYSIFELEVYGSPSNNIAPTVSITSPTSGASYTAPATITINANAADADGTISSVAFYNGSTLIGTDNSSPYNVTWSNVASGTYSITAVATDNGGASTTSSAVNNIIVSGGTNSCTGVAAYSPTKVYNTGDLVVYNSNLYKALANGLANVPPDYCPSCGWFQLMGACSTLKSAQLTEVQSVNNEKVKLIAFPNPSSDVMKISYSVKSANNVKLVIYDINGREIEVLQNTIMDAGNYVATWNIAGNRTGVYYARLTSDNDISTIKLVVK